MKINFTFTKSFFSSRSSCKRDTDRRNIFKFTMEINIC